MKSKTRGVGRPSYPIKWPNGKFTMADLMVANGVNPKNGKGKLCTKLTLVKGLQRDMFMVGDNGKPDTNRPRRNSTIVRVKDETREPNSKSGLGRKTFVYIRRAKLVKGKDVTVNVGTKAKSTAPKSEAYEAQKAALLAPEPAVAPTEVAAPAAESTGGTPPATSTLPVVPVAA